MKRAKQRKMCVFGRLHNKRRRQTALENIFDISDTYQRYGAEQRLWNVNIKRDEADLAETLESRYGKLEDKDNLAFAIISSEISGIMAHAVLPDE